MKTLLNKKNYIKILSTVVPCLALASIGSSAWAKEKHVHNKTTSIKEEHSIRYSQAAPEEGGSQGFSYGIGFTTIQTPTINNSSPGISALFHLGNSNFLQAYFSIPFTSPLNLGGGVLFKHTIAEGKNAGFHIGAGTGMGNLNGGLGGNFVWDISALAGIHAQIPGLSELSFHLDGGARFQLITTSPSTTNFQLSGLSPAFGLSIFYLF